MLLMLLIALLVHALLSNGCKIEVSFKEGEDAHFFVNASNPIIYSHFGGADGDNKLNPYPLYMTVDRNNQPQDLTCNLNDSILCGRLQFDGDHANGRACYAITSVNIRDAKRYKMYYKEKNQAPFKEDFILLVIDGNSKKTMVATTRNRPVCANSTSTVGIPTTETVAGSTNSANDDTHITSNKRRLEIQWPILAALLVVVVFVDDVA